MYLIDTDVVSELRKGARADAGVRAFFAEAGRSESLLFLSVITIGEIRRGIARIRHRGDDDQALQLERWLNDLLQKFDDRILSFDADCVCRIPRTPSTNRLPLRRMCMGSRWSPATRRISGQRECYCMTRSEIVDQGYSQKS
jgi:hypothetical protein